MLCDEFEIRFHELLDKQRGPDVPRGDATRRRAALEEHARECSRCRRLAAAYVAVLTGLEQTRPLVGGGEEDGATNDLAGRVLAALEPVGTLRMRRRRRLMALAGAAAIVLVVALPRPWSGRGWRAFRPAAPPARSAARPIGATPGKAPASSSGQTAAADSKTRPYRVLARETSASLSVAMQLLPVGSFGTTFGPQPQPDAPAASVVRDVSDSLTPVTRPTAGVFNSFMELLAGSDEDTQDNGETPDFTD